MWNKIPFINFRSQNKKIDNEPDKFQAFAKEELKDYNYVKVQSFRTSEHRIKNQIRLAMEVINLNSN